MNDKEMKTLYDSLEAPAELRDKVLSAINTPKNTQINSRISIKRIPKKRTLIIAAAVMLSLTMLVSAVTIAYNIYNGIYMVPGMGLFDGFNENVRAIPKVLDFGDAQIEMAMTCEQGGVNMFYMSIYAEGGYKNNKNPDKKDYENLEIVLSDGTSIYLNGTTEGSGNRNDAGRGEAPKESYYFMYKYEYENFPAECNFTLKNNAGISTEVTLTPIEAKSMKITDNGIKRVKIIPAAEGSRIFSYNIEVINPSLTEKEAKWTFYRIEFSWDDEHTNEILYKDGTISGWYGGGSGSGCPIFATDENADYKYHVFGENNFSYDFNGGEINKIIIRKLFADLTFDDACNLDFNKKVNLPVPEKGELIEYDIPLKITEIGEFTIAVSAIEHEKNNLILYASENDISYSGTEDISDIYFGITNAEGNGGSTGGGNEYSHKYTIPISEDYTSDTFEAYITSISYTIHGYWEVDFE